MDYIAGARDKHKRAKKHIEDFESCLNLFLRDHAYKIVPDPETPAIQKAFLLRPEPIPGTLVCIVGDAIHNLRSSLDHLAYAAAAYNGLPTKLLNGVSFTTRRDKSGPDGFDEAIKERKVSRIGVAWTDFLKAMEPYHGGNGSDLYVVSALDKIDKHRNLLDHELLGDKYRFDGIHMIPIKRGVPLEEGIKLAPDPANANRSAYTQIRIRISETVPGLDPNAWASDVLNRLAFAVKRTLVAAGLPGAKLFPPNS